MDVEQATIQHAGDHLYDQRLAQPAPVAMWGPMLHLAGPEPSIEASVAQCQFKDGSTHWRVAWLTGDRLVYADAQRSAADWTGYSEEQFDPDGTTQKVTSWAKRLTEITEVTIDDDSPRPRAAAKFVWDYRLTAVFRGGRRLELPLFPGPIYAGDRERNESFATMLIARL